MKKYVKSNLTDYPSLLDIEEISSIIYVDDISEVEHYDTSSMLDSAYIQASDADTLDYSTWTRAQLLELKQKNPMEFNKIRSDKVLFEILKHEDLTLEQLMYANGRKTMERDVSIDEIKHMLKLFRECTDFYRVPSNKNREFIKYLKGYGITLAQVDIENIMHNLHIQDFSEGRYSTDGDYWGHALILFEFRDPTFTFSCGKSLPKSELPLKIYIKVDENLSTKESVSVVSFHKPDYVMKHPIKYPIDKENPDTWK